MAHVGVWSLMLEVSLELGVWCLEFQFWCFQLVFSLLTLPATQAPSRPTRSSTSKREPVVPRPNRQAGQGIAPDPTKSGPRLLAREPRAFERRGKFRRWAAVPSLRTTVCPVDA